MESKEFVKGKTVVFGHEIEYSTGSIVSKTVIKKETGNISLFAFDRGESLSEHTAPFDAVVQVLEGAAEILIAGEPQVVRAGEGIIMPAHIPHAVIAVEKMKMLLTMIRK